MRSIAVAALCAVMTLPALASKSEAAIIPINLISGSGSANFTHTSVGPANASFDDFFTFTSLSPFTLNFSLSSSLPGGNTSPVLSSTQYSFNSGVPQTVSAGLVSPVSSVTFPQGAFGFYQSPGVLAAGSYFFELAGATVGGSGNGSSLTNAVSVSVSAVPLPGTLPMFAAALVMLGGLTINLRRRNGQSRLA